jgi:hypothetical protein
MDVICAIEPKNLFSQTIKSEDRIADSDDIFMKHIAETVTL